MFLSNTLSCFHPYFDLLAWPQDGNEHSLVGSLLTLDEVVPGVGIVLLVSLLFAIVEFSGVDVLVVVVSALPEDVSAGHGDLVADSTHV